MPRLSPSRQELTVDQQARLCSHIGFTGDTAPRKGSKLIIEAWRQTSCDQIKDLNEHMSLREHYVLGVLCPVVFKVRACGHSASLLVNCMKETTSGISISYGKQMHIHNTIHLYSDGCIGWYWAVKERTSVEVLDRLKKYYVVVWNIRSLQWHG